LVNLACLEAFPRAFAIKRGGPGRREALPPPQVILSASIGSGFACSLIGFQIPEAIKGALYWKGNAFFPLFLCRQFLVRMIVALLLCREVDDSCLDWKKWHVLVL
jgi:hypothetical protein